MSDVKHETAMLLTVGKSRFSPSDRATDTAIVCDGEIVAECFGRSAEDRYWNSLALAKRLVKRDAAYPKLVQALRDAMGYADYCANNGGQQADRDHARFIALLRELGEAE